MTFWKRFATTIIGLPSVALLIFIGGIPLLVICAFFALWGLREFYLAFSKKDRLIHVIGYLATVGYFGAIYVFGGGYWLLIALTSFIIVVQTCLVVFFRKLPIIECITTIYGFLYIPFMLSFVVLVREHELGPYYIFLIFIACFGCDTFAYLVGSLIGKNKLKNSPSPSKSVEGLIGGVVGATVAGLIYGFIIALFFNYPETTAHIVVFATIICFFGAIFSIVGDLAASAIKRHCDVKDFGNVFPGHGGVLDRLDSIITVAPVVYLVMNIMMLLVDII
ncbi:MAG: phosphatidate cytidylyltransferase [Clostridiales bacterium]|jgi:phosphatidate cytidylyltransferase|nr:phosphatidate cytidylyltransferase [Clostridiales bacterium]